MGVLGGLGMGYGCLGGEGLRMEREREVRERERERGEGSSIGGWC